MIDIPTRSHAKIDHSNSFEAVDEQGEPIVVNLVTERPLTIFVDRKEIVTLMTMGAHPELLTLGYLKNQGFFSDIAEIKLVQVDWQTNAVAVVTAKQNSNFDDQMAKRTVTSGCGQGTVFGELIDKLVPVKKPHEKITRTDIYALLDTLSASNQVYKKAGAVHSCGLCIAGELEYFVEDVGRHNAVDTIAGYMWLNQIQTDNAVFYTTGRLTSEMVIKMSQMAVPVLLSRSGATQMGVEMAQKSGITMLSRAKGKRFNVLNGAENIDFTVA